MSWYKKNRKLGRLLHRMEVHCCTDPESCNLSRGIRRKNDWKSWTSLHPGPIIWKYRKSLSDASSSYGYQLQHLFWILYMFREILYGKWLTSQEVINFDISVACLFRRRPQLRITWILWNVRGNITADQQIIGDNGDTGMKTDRGWKF